MYAYFGVDQQSQSKYSDMYTNSGIFFNLKCDSEISTEIDILIILQRFSSNVFINVFHSIVLVYWILFF